MLLGRRNGFIGVRSDDARWDLFLPPAPSGITTAAGNAQVTVSWTAPTVIAQAPVVDYKVQYSSNGGASWATANDSVSSATSAVISGLSNGVGYVFRVAATNAIGQGAWSAATAEVVPSLTPDAIILSGYVNPVYGRDGGASVMTLAGTSNGRPYYAVGNDAVAWSGSEWRYTYYGDLFATNSTNSSLPPTSGWSSPGIVIWYSAAGEPSAPTGLAAGPGNQLLSLSWNAPAVNGSGAITGYTVEYTPSGGSPQAASTGSTATSYQLTGLTNGTSYSVRVAAINAYGTGPWSAAVTNTPANIPTTIYLSGYDNPSYGMFGVSLELTRSGTVNGKPQYVSGVWAIAWTGSEWRLTYYGDWMASNTNNTPLPPNSGWNQASIVITGGSPL